MEEPQFREDGWNIEEESDFRQPICVGCVRDCADCLVRTLAGTGHRGEPIIPKEQHSSDNEEVFDV